MAAFGEVGHDYEAGFQSEMLVGTIIRFLADNSFHEIPSQSSRVMFAVQIGASDEIEAQIVAFNKVPT